MDWRGALLVALGGALGALARVGASATLPRLEFPWATLAVNLIGSFALGYFFLHNGDTNVRLFVAVGFLGAFTTLSTFSMETVSLLNEERIGMAIANILANGLGGPLVALMGWRLAMPGS